jgi:parallel beta-helix repeat protein
MRRSEAQTDGGAKRTGFVLVVAVIGVVLVVNAGQLSPPPGPPAPTMKTLTQVEPRTPVQNLSSNGTALYVIDQPGSYYLTGNITGKPGKNGIEITTNGVALDLNGFELVGVEGSLTGVLADGQANLAIRNGMIRAWGAEGVHLAYSYASQLERLQAANNAGRGLVTDSGSTVINCTARGNGEWGIHALGSTVSNCTCTGNTIGIAGVGSLIRGNTAVDNGTNISASSSTVINNHAP